jgi:hypothetical protein
MIGVAGMLILAVIAFFVFCNKSGGTEIPSYTSSAAGTVM